MGEKGGGVGWEGFFGKEEGGDFGLVDDDIIGNDVCWETLGLGKDWCGGFVWPGYVS